MGASTSVVVRNARIATCVAHEGDRLGTVDRGALVVRDGTVVWIGEDDACRGVPGARVIDAGGRLVTPGLVDPHTHLVFAGSRAAEFERKMAGVDYRTLAAEGGGIMSTVRATRAATPGTLNTLVHHRLRALVERGVTLVEVKSGYGLDLAHEARLLQIARFASEGAIIEGERLEIELPVARTTTTLLGAHAVPPEHDRAAYLDLVCDEMIPRFGPESSDPHWARLAETCDVYLDENAFTVAEARRVLEAAKRSGFRLRAHVGQFADVGGAELVAELGGLSCDHLEHVGDAGLRAMAAAGTRAVLLPGAWRTLRQAAPDAARMRAAGVGVAVGTDFNPGTSPTLDLPAMVALAVRDAGLPAEEALLAMTVEAAAACGDREAGALREGGRADLVLWDHDDPRVFAYALGAVRPALVLVGGTVAVDAGVRPAVLT